MDIDKDLLELEKGFWTGGPDHYRKHLDETCLVVFSEMAGVMGREEIASMVGKTIWKDLKVEPKAMVRPTPDTAVIAYHASATRENGEAYSANVGSGYVKRDGEWKMAFHHQTPAKTDKKA